MKVKLRGHHLICLHFFHGEGYNSEFVTNLSKVIQRAGAGEDIEIYSGADDVCRKCPNLQGEICFYSKNADDGIREMDRMAIKLLHLKNNSQVRWADLKKKIPDILSEWVRAYCKDCDWKWACIKDSTFKVFFNEKAKHKI
jgi:hypothetical protein